MSAMKKNEKLYVVFGGGETWYLSFMAGKSQYDC